MIIRWWWLWCQKRIMDLYHAILPIFFIIIATTTRRNVDYFFLFLLSFFVVDNIFFPFTSSFHIYVGGCDTAVVAVATKKPKPKTSSSQAGHTQICIQKQKRQLRRWEEKYQKKVTGYYYCTLCLWVCVCMSILKAIILIVKMWRSEQSRGKC